MATKERIMRNCLRHLSMVYGQSVNTYAEEKLYNMIDDAIEYCFKERFWDRHIKKLKVELQNGYPVKKDLNQVIKEFEDIQCVLTDEAVPYELARGNSSIIPIDSNGTVPVYYTRSDDESKIVRILPAISNTSVWLIFRTLCKPSVYQKFLNEETIIPEADKPFEFRPDDEIPFDSLAIQYYTCYNYMMIKDDNPSATNNFYNMFNKRISQLKNDQLNSTMSFDSGSNQSYFGVWW